jgi:Tol biopolymer transport system component/DNA-binding winged helix-turn-helix (wHTH) protein
MRRGGSVPTVYRFEAFTLAVSENRLRRGDVEIPLQPKVFDALVLFVRRPGELLTKERLLEELWPDVVVGEEALAQVVRKLRQALGDDVREPRFVQTVTKRGYRFLPPVVEVVEERKEAAARAAEARVEETPVERPSNALARGAGRRLVPRLASVALLLLVAIAWIAWSERDDSTAPERAWISKRLTSLPEREQEGVFSPDGRSFAFEINLGGQFDLHLSAFAGGRRVRLTETPEDDEYYPRFAPDGSSLVFSREPVGGGAPSVWSIPIFGGDERLLVADASYGAPSPDGRSLAYARFLRDGRFALRLRDLATAEERQLAVVDEWLGSIAWSPSGDELAFVTPEAVYRLDVATGASRAVHEDLSNVRTVAWEGRSGALVHDGSKATSGARIWRVDRAGGAAAMAEPPGSSWHPALDGEGRRMLVTVEHKTRQLWRVDPSGRDLRSLPLPTTAECFDVDPSGRRLVVDDWDPAPGADSIELVELESGATRRLGDGLCPSFSPDGRRVAFLASREGAVDVVVLDLGNGAERRVARDVGLPGFVEANLDRRPAWSPDGARLIVERMRASGWDLVEIELATGALRSLIAGELDAGAYSPDGTRFAFCGATPLGSGLHWIELLAGTTRRISGTCSYRAAPTWTSDGSGLRLLIGERRNPEIVTFDLEGRETGARIAVERPPDPAFWGHFDVRPLGESGWIVLSERYEGDLYLLERSDESRESAEAAL